MQCDANTLTLTLPAEPDSVSRARRALSDFAQAAGAAPATLDAVRLASSEAITNAVLHAYRQTPGRVYVTAAVASEELWILVADDGVGLEPAPDRPGLGLGLALISRLSDDLSVVPRAGGGTEVRMRFALVASTMPSRTGRVRREDRRFRSGDADPPLSSMRMRGAHPTTRRFA